MRQKRSFWNLYKMMGIINALKCCQNVCQVVVCPCPGAFFKWWLCVDLDHFYDRVKFVSCRFCMGDRLYSNECLCISKFVLILHILSTQVSDTGPMGLWLLTTWKRTAFCLQNYGSFKAWGSSTCCVPSDLKRTEKYEAWTEHNTALNSSMGIDIMTYRIRIGRFGQDRGYISTGILKSIHLPSLGRIFTKGC